MRKLAMLLSAAAITTGCAQAPRLEKVDVPPEYVACANVAQDHVVQAQGWPREDVVIHLASVTDSRATFAVTSVELVLRAGEGTLGEDAQVLEVVVDCPAGKVVQMEPVPS
jgi:hypothetical protein